jgi:hypothetical protein
MRVRVGRAYPGSLNRRVSNAACARLRGANRFFAPLFTGARSAPRGAGSLGRGQRVPVHSLHF